MGYFYIFGCIAFTVYGQLILKWRMNSNLNLPEHLSSKAFYLVKLILTDPFIFSGFSSAFLASLFWMGAMTKFSISFAYPFMSLSFILVMFGAAIFFGENINILKILGTVLVILGLVTLSQSNS